jgi:heme/copper-type cytochrome/quinol oxidase subunit 3
MYDLLTHHFSQSDGSTKVYGMSFTLSFIHALHVIGGMVFLGFVIFQAYREKYDHERHFAVDHCASYWHFLDVVWACMLITFLISK